MRNIFFRLATRLSILMLAVLSACGDLDKLSSSADVVSFQIDTVYTASVELGIPQIDRQEGVIQIPLLYGKYIPDIRFKAQVRIDKDAKQLLNLNPDTVTVSRWTEDVMFYVAAQNGSVREWAVRLVPVAQDKPADVLGMAVADFTPSTCVVGDSAFVFVDGTERYIKVMAPQAVFPLTVKPSFRLSEGCKVVGGEQELTFQSRLDLKTVSIEAEDGFVQDWTVFVETGDIIYADNQAGYPGTQTYSTNLAESSMDVSLLTGDGNQIARFEVDSVQNVVSIVVRNSTSRSPQYPLSVRMDFPLRFNQMSIGLQPGETITFSGPDQVKTFYLYDQYNDLKKLWKVRIEPYKNNEAEVTSFMLTRSTPSSVKFLMDSTEINSENATITLVVNDGTDAFPVQLRANVGVSAGATLFGIENGKDFVMDNLNAQKTFMVIAEDGTEKQWTIRLVFAGALATDADVETFRITSYHGAAGKLQMSQTADVDKVNKIITLTITAKGSDLPLQLKAAMSLSYKATMTQGAFSPNDFLTFNSLADTYRFTVRSQDGLTENQYTIRLDDHSPAAGTAADLLTFKANNIAAGYVVASTSVDQAGRTITMHVTQKGSGQFSFIPQYTTSDGAIVAGISPTAALRFASLKEQKTFSVTSEDGQTVNRWRIQISYEPPLTNGTMDWSGTTLPGWSSSNTSYATIAQRATGQDGTSCTLLTTGSAAGFFASGSIFLGRFEMSLSQVSNPKAMTHFGIAFDGRPKSLSFDVSYSTSNDKGSVDFQLLNYTGSGSIEYHKYGSVNSAGKFVADASREPGVTVVAYGYTTISNTNGWTRITLPLDYYYTEDQMDVTHIFITFSTSYQGDQFKGSSDSKMYIDNIVLNY